MKIYSDDELLKHADELVGELSDRSREIEQARRLPADIAERFGKAGFFHTLVPSRYGGSQVHPSTLVKLIRRLAEGDPSAGWNVMIGATTGLLSASIEPAFAEEIYGDGAGVLTVGVTAPMGRAEVVKGGYSVSGRWPFGSGSDNASWIAGGSLVMEAGEPRKGKADTPEIHLMMFRRDQVNIEDTWHVSGLRGTGSHHFNVENQFVPEGRLVVMGSRSKVEAPLYQFPMLGLLAMGVSAVSLGAGFKALKAFKALSVAKVPTGGAKGLAYRNQVQSLVAMSRADLESAETYLHASIDSAWQLALKGERLPVEAKANLRLAAVNAARRSIDAIQRLYHAGGGSSIYDDSDLQRCFRDVNVASQHLMVGLPIYEVVGRVDLGLPAGSLL